MGGVAYPSLTNEGSTVPLCVTGDCQELDKLWKIRPRPPRSDVGGTPHWSACSEYQTKRRRVIVLVCDSHTSHVLDRCLSVKRAIIELKIVSISIL
jgi:hypothetical protein